MDKYNAVVGSTMYVGGEKVAEDVTFELPGLALQTADMPAMGTVSVPLTGLLDDMTMTITKIGIDRGFAKMSCLQTMDIEFRWVQNRIDTAGKTFPESCKAFLKAMPQEIPGVSVEVGSVSEIQNTYTILRYQLFTNNEEMILVDRMNQMLRVNGVDLMDTIRKML